MIDMSTSSLLTSFFVSSLRSFGVLPKHKTSLTSALKGSNLFLSVTIALLEIALITFTGRAVRVGYGQFSTYIYNCTSYSRFSLTSAIFTTAHISRVDPAYEWVRSYVEQDQTTMARLTDFRLSTVNIRKSSKASPAAIGIWHINKVKAQIRPLSGKDSVVSQVAEVYSPSDNGPARVRPGLDYHPLDDGYHIPSSFRGVRAVVSTTVARN
jgi:hypothetical protein